MGAQRLVARGEIRFRVTVEIAEVCRQAVGAVLKRRPPQGPQGVLQPFGQGHEAFAAQDGMGVLEARVSETGQPQSCAPHPDVQLNLDRGGAAR